MRKSILSFLAFSLLLVVAVIFVTSFHFAITSSAQNANSSTQNSNRSTNKNQNDSRSIAPPGGAQEDFSKNTWELPEDADKTKNPITATPESIAKGKELYMAQTKGNCVFCHGDTGAGNEANIAAGKLRRKPADLTNKERQA